MAFRTEFHFMCKFDTEQELYELLEYGRGKLVRTGFRVYPAGQKVIAIAPDRRAVGIVKIVASIAEINFHGEEVTEVEMELVRKLDDEESRLLTSLSEELFFGGTEQK